MDQAQVGLLYSDIANAFFKGEFGEMVHYQDAVRSIYYQLMDLGVHRDIITERDDLSRYRVVIVPYLPAVDDPLLERLTRFAQNGLERCSSVP